MGKFSKRCLAIAAIFIGVGIVMGAVVSIIAGRSSFSLMGEREISFGKWGNIEAFQGIRWNVSNDYVRNKLVVSGKEIGEGKYSEKIDGSQVKGLHIDAGACWLEIEEWEEEEIGIEVSGSGECNYDIREGQLYITGFQTGSVHINNSIEIYIPAGMEFDQVVVKADTGQVTVGDIRSDRFTCTLGAGKADFYNIYTKGLDLTVDTGGLDFEGRVDGDIRANCAIGGLNLQLAGRERDYNYSMSCDLGTIAVDGDYFSRLIDEKKVKNKAAYDVRLECFMGSINLKFNN